MFSEERRRLGQIIRARRRCGLLCRGHARRTEAGRYTGPHVPVHGGRNVLPVEIRRSVLLRIRWPAGFF